MKRILFNTITVCSLIMMIGGLLYSPSLMAKADTYDILINGTDEDMQNQLDNLASRSKDKKKSKLKCLSVFKEYSITLVDITDKTSPKLASIGGDDMRYAASMPKIAILFAAFEKFKTHDKKLKLNNENRKLLTRMIRNSSNTAATAMINKIGKKELNKILIENKLYDSSRGGGLWVGKEYGRGVAYSRSSIGGISHGATTNQAANFYYMMEDNALEDEKLTKEMKVILSQPAINHKFVKGLKGYKPKSKIFRKSGTWSRFHADSALVERDGMKYIAVAIAETRSKSEKSKGSACLSKLIVGLDKIVSKPYENNNQFADKYKKSLAER